MVLGKLSEWGKQKRGCEMYAEDKESITPCDDVYSVTLYINIYRREVGEEYVSTFNGANVFGCRGGRGRGVRKLGFLGSDERKI